MTHNEIYTKFMIEYDKANVTSSYPSLTKYEAATLLDRAYLALISRKLTGNNTRRVPFEYDTKAIEDLRPLVFTKRFKQEGKSRTVSNEYKFAMPDDLMYYIEGVANYGSEREIVLPVNHQIARKFKLTNSNFPWVSHPVSYIEGSEVYVLIDPFLHTSSPDLDGTYIKMPASFVKSLKEIEDELNENPSGGGDNGGDDNGGDNNGENNDPIVVSPPTVTPDSLIFTTSLTISITAPQADKIFYKINGHTSEYTKPINITETTTIVAYATIGEYSSEEVTKEYTKQLSLPTVVNPPRFSTNTTFVEETYVTLSADAGCLIEYTKDGSNPLDSSTLHIYTVPFIIAETTTIKAIARKGDNHSTVATLTYTKQQQPDPQNIPTVTILECRYVAPSANQAASIYVEYYINLNNIESAVDRRILIGNSNDVYRGTDTVTVTLSKLYQLILQYNDGDCKVKINLRGSVNDVLYSEAVADINELPTNVKTIKIIFPEDLETTESNGNNVFITADSHTDVTFPFEVWEYEYDPSDLVHPTSTKKLSSSEYQINSRNIEVINANSNIMDEYEQLPFSVQLYYHPYVYTGNMDGVYIQNGPTFFDVYSDPDKYRSMVETWVAPWNAPTPSYYGQEILEIPNAFTFKHTLSVTSNGTTVTLNESYPMGIEIRKDRMLSRLWVVIPASMCTWEQFIADPQTYITAIANNEYGPAITYFRDLRDTAIIAAIKDDIMQIVSPSAERTVDLFLAGLRTKYTAKRVNLNTASANIKKDFFNSLTKSEKLQYGVPNNLSFYETWTQPILLEYLGHCADDNDPNHKIGPRFARLYLWQDGKEGEHPYSTLRLGGKNLRVVNALGQPENSFKVLDQREVLNEGDIFVYLLNENDKTLRDLTYNLGDRLEEVTFYDLIVATDTLKWIDNVNPAEGEYGIPTEHKLLDGSGNKIKLSIPYEDSIMDYEGNTYNRYGGYNCYKIKAFQAKDTIDISHIQFDDYEIVDDEGDTNNPSNLSAPLLEEETSNNLGEATLGEIILQ